MSSLRPWFAAVSCIFVLISLSATSPAQDVLTWHNDIQRTGQYLAETTLSPSTVSQTTFGLLWQYQVAGEVYAQPLAVQNVASPKCAVTWPCNLVFVATERDMLYAFDGDGHTTQPLWTTNLAALANGTYLDCANFQPPCMQGVVYPDIGVTGTPVIDKQAGILYVVSVVLLIGTNPTQVQYYVHAIDITDGSEKPHSPQLITASVPGAATPPNDCGYVATQGTVTFDPNHHLQRTGLLLLPVGSNNTQVLYVAFTPVNGESQNGWILGYTYDTTNGFVPLAKQFNTTPYGTGGGIWQAGSGLAAGTNSNGNTYIFVGTGNGTFDASSPSTPHSEYGDSLLRLSISTVNGHLGELAVDDYFTPSDQAYRCTPPNDVDFGSGGVMVLQESFYQGHADLLISADKEAKLFVADRGSLGGYGGTDSILQELQTPVASDVWGYWANPAYWKWNDQQGTHRAIYYAARIVDGTNKAPLPLNMYALSTAPPGPIPSALPTYGTPTLFCGYGTTPSISAQPPGTTGGILWAIEATNSHNPGSPLDCMGDYGPAALHAYDATNPSPQTELYNGRVLSTSTGYPAKFSTPTIFNHRVYLGTLGTDRGTGANGLVNVFGLCGSPSHCSP